MLFDFTSEFPVPFPCFSLSPRRSLAPEKSLSLQGEPWQLNLLNSFVGRVRVGAVRWETYVGEGLGLMHQAPQDFLLSPTGQVGSSQFPDEVTGQSDLMTSIS